METKIANWREKELPIEAVFEKYPEIPKLVILKTDVHRRGYILTEKAHELFNKGDYQSQADTIFGKKEGTNKIPIGLVFRDGTSLVGGYYENYGIRDPYVIDDIDGKFFLTDNGKVYEEVEFWREPDFYRKKTSKGTPMGEVVNVRPQRLNVAISRVCHFWDKPGEGCKYCNVGINGIDSVKKGIPDLFDYDEVAEAVAEAVKQKGRFAMIMVTTGSILTGEKVFDDEVDEIIKAFEKIKPIFKTNDLKVQLIASAYDKEQLKRLKEATGIIGYTSDIEVMNKELFEWICPGKAAHIGYDEWKKRIFDAVEVFGEGNVNSGIVGGVELAQPNGFKTEEEALKAYLEEAEDFAKHGVSIAYIVWGVCGIFHNQVVPSLDYYVALAKGLNEINVKYNLKTYFDDYRRCGNHPNTDIGRIYW